MLLHQIEALVEVGVVHVVLAVSYHAEQLEQEMQVNWVSNVQITNVLHKSFKNFFWFRF